MSRTKNKDVLLGMLFIIGVMILSSFSCLFIYVFETILNKDIGFVFVRYLLIDVFETLLKI